MSRRHIAMIGNPIVSHVLPGLAVIRELVARGHRVTYADAPNVADLVTPTGAEFVPWTTTLPVVTNDWPQDAISAMTLFLDDAIQALPQLRAHYDEDPADLYLYDIGSYAGRALAEGQNRPFVQLSPTYVSWEGYQQEVGDVLMQLPGADAYRRKFTDWLAGCGAKTLDVDTFSGMPDGTIAMITKAMQPNADRVNTDVVTFVGPCLDDRTDQGGWTRPPGAEKVLLVSLGSAYTLQPEFYRQCLAAFGDLDGWHVVLQIGRTTDAEELGEIPANVEVHHWVPQLAILEQADAFVTHAGMGGSSEGLYTGVPMIAVPQGAEQFANADQLVKLGVARRIDTADADADTLRTALLEHTADPEVRRRSDELRAELLAEGGTRRAVDLIEAALG
ncbi:macrolide family glycosyltransferase [Streptomyces sp. NPDC054863]